MRGKKKGGNISYKYVNLIDLCLYTVDQIGALSPS